MITIKTKGYAILAVALLLASSMPVAFKLGSAVPTMTLLFYMSLVGTLTSYAIMRFTGNTENVKTILKDRRQLIALLVTGLFVFTFEPLGLAYSAHYISADLVAVVFRTWPIFLILFAPLVIKERITKWDVAGVVIGFLGLFVTLVGGTAISIPLAALPFVGLVVAVAISEAVSSAVSKRYNYELTSSVFIYNVLSLIFFAPIALATGAPLLSLSTNAVIAILFLGVFTQAAFAILFYEALRLVKTARASVSFIMASFITMLLSYLVLGEAIQPYYIVIAVAVVAGVLVQKFAPREAGNFVVSKKRHMHPRPLYDVTSAFVDTKHPVIYNTMRGNGRVLAFYVEPQDAGSVTKEKINSMSGDDCVLFTDKHHDIASKPELEFIREITGCSKEHLLVMGSGDPDKVIDKFSAVGTLIKRNDEAGIA